MLEGAPILKATACPLTKYFPMVLWKDGVPEAYHCWRGPQSTSQTPLNMAIRNLHDKAYSWCVERESEYVRKIETIYFREVPISHIAISPRHCTSEEITEIFREIAYRVEANIEIVDVPNLTSGRIDTLIKHMGWDRFPKVVMRSIKLGFFCKLATSPLEQSALQTYDFNSGKLTQIGQHLDHLHLALKRYEDGEIELDADFIDRIYVTVATIMSDPRIAMAQNNDHLQGLSGYISFWIRFAESASRHVDRKVGGSLHELKEALENAKQGK